MVLQDVAVGCCSCVFNTVNVGSSTRLNFYITGAPRSQNVGELHTQPYHSKNILV